MVLAKSAFRRIPLSYNCSLFDAWIDHSNFRRVEREVITQVPSTTLDIFLIFCFIFIFLSRSLRIGWNPIATLLQCYIDLLGAKLSINPFKPIVLADAISKVTLCVKVFVFLPCISLIQCTYIMFQVKVQNLKNIFYGLIFGDTDICSFAVTIPENGFKHANWCVLCVYNECNDLSRNTFFFML